MGDNVCEEKKKKDFGPAVNKDGASYHNIVPCPTLVSYFSFMLSICRNKKTHKGTLNKYDIAINR